MYKSRHYIILLLSILILSACGTSPTETEPLPTRIPSNTPPPTFTPTNTPAPTSTPMASIPRSLAINPQEQVTLRFVHAAPDVGRLSAEAEGLLLASNLDFGAASGLTGIESGEYTLKIQDEFNTPIFEQSITFTGGQTRIFLITGTPQNLQLSEYNENTDALGANEARITFINGLSASTFAIQRDGSDIVPTLEFGQMSPGIIIAPEETTYTVTENGQPLFTFPVDPRERFNETLVITGTREEPEFITFDERAPATAFVRFVHAGQTIPVVDIYLDGNLVTSNIGYSRSSARQRITAQTFDVALYNAGENPTNAEPIFTEEISFDSDEIISAIIAGTSDNIEIFTVEEDTSPIRPEQTRIAFVNGLVNTSEIRLNFPGETPDEFDNSLGVGQSSGFADISASTYDFQWQNTQEQIVEFAEEVLLEQGRSYLYILTGQQSNTPLILSDELTIATELADLPIDMQPSPTPRRATRVRFINAIHEAPTINIFVGDTNITNMLGYGAGTNYFEISEGPQTVDARNSDTAEIIASVDFEFAPATDYSLFIYGMDLGEHLILVVEDVQSTIAAQSNATVRLVNLSLENGVDFQLGFVESSGEGGIRASATADSPRDRPQVAFGTNRVSNTVQAGSSSAFSTINAGINDLIIIDPGPNTVASVIPNEQFDPERSYDVIVYEELFNNIMRGFVIQQP